MRKAIILAGAAALAFAPATAPAQPAAAPPATAAVDAAKVVADVRRILGANYVLSETRPKLDAALAAGLASGRYNVADPGELARRINADLEAVAHDKHLGIEYDPAQHAELASQPPGSGADDAGPSAEDIRRATRMNHGIASLKLLPGNIRAMEYNGFVWAGPKTAEALDNAMRFLRDGDAVIVDLRRNGGGSPQAVQYLVSHFLEANKPIVTFHMRGDPAETLSTLPTLPAGRMIGKPLYVLTSGATGSAAEEFTGHVAGYRLGELVGANTGGAGFRNTLVPIAGAYVLSVSVGRAVLASTGKDWEGVGIAPHAKVASDKALETAQARALRRLAASAPANEKRRLEAEAAVLEAQANPIKTALPLASYAGTYGERTVAAEGGGLTWRRGTGPKLEMVAVGPNEFTFADDPMTRVHFTVAANGATGMRMVRGDGSIVEAQRTQ